LSGELRAAYVSGFAEAGDEAPEERNTLSIPWVITAAILCGIGIFLVTGALIRLAGGLTNWSWWIGVLPAVVGFMMLMNPRAGSQGRH
jgi:predicted cobalt transporter CbtA